MRHEASGREAPGQGLLLRPPSGSLDSRAGGGSTQHLRGDGPAHILTGTHPTAGGHSSRPDPVSSKRRNVPEGPGPMPSLLLPGLPRDASQPAPLASPPPDTRRSRTSPRILSNPTLGLNRLSWAGEEAAGPCRGGFRLGEDFGNVQPGHRLCSAAEAGSACRPFSPAATDLPGLPAPPGQLPSGEAQVPPSRIPRFRRILPNGGLRCVCDDPFRLAMNGLHRILR